MHLIQLFLEVINLFLERLLLIQLLIIFLLLGSCIGGNLRHLDIFIDYLLQHFCADGKSVFL